MQTSEGLQLGDDSAVRSSVSKYYGEVIGGGQARCAADRHISAAVHQGTIHAITCTCYAYAAYGF